MKNRLIDSQGRIVNYLRISVTDRCNLNCCYCNTSKREFIPHDEILSYEEILKAVEIMAKKGIKVILLDLADQLFPRGAHPETAFLLQNYLENHGIEIRLGCSIRNLENDQENACCFLEDQSMEKADCVAVCTGIQPNCEFLNKNQVNIENPPFELFP